MTALRSFSGPGIRVGALPPDRKVLSVSETAIAADIHQPFPVHVYLCSERTLDLVAIFYYFSESRYIGLRKSIGVSVQGNSHNSENFSGAGHSDTVNVWKRVDHLFVTR